MHLTSYFSPSLFAHCHPGRISPHPKDKDHVIIFFNILVTLSLNTSNAEAVFESQLMHEGCTVIKPGCRKRPWGRCPTDLEARPVFSCPPTRPHLSRLGLFAMSPFSPQAAWDDDILLPAGWDFQLLPHWKPVAESQTDLISSPNSCCAASGRSPNQSGSQSPHL